MSFVPAVKRVSPVTKSAPFCVITLFAERGFIARFKFPVSVLIPKLTEFVST